ncbi:hypothetical protein [uncultured Maricaulis sp.]|uniref:hypothetical protein n=1 Tax=uncultured Maricaulis sp. TaxID=174710 RepID=UPI0030DA9742|tara:strand:+ start:5475 stop:5939 length:465 start_codon:yes stop_codon:yes gene_type:complete
MTQELEVLDEGQKGWLSWIVARDLSARSARHRLDSLAQRMVLVGNGTVGRPIGKSWLEISREDAELRAHNFAKTGIAYALRDRLRPGLEEPRVRMFFERFTGQARVFSNWGSGLSLALGGGLSSWEPISESTFDMAFGLTDGDLVGIFCIEDED